MQIRLFTAGTHNGLNFSNEDINNIAAATATSGADKIPFVLGHPKNNLPVFGYLPKTVIRTYQEGDKISMGFDRAAAEMDEEGLAAIRSLGRNKLSVRIEDGIIKHIGLVKKAAVAENNTQDFSAMTGDFAAPDDFCDAEENSQLWEKFKRFLKTNKTDVMSEDRKEKEKQNADFEAIRTEVKEIGETVGKLAQLLTGQEQEKKKTALTADFAAADFSHLTDKQKAKAIDLCARLTPEEVIDYKALLKAGNKKPATPGNGSVAANFGNPDDKRTAADIIGEQIKSVM